MGFDPIPREPGDVAWLMGYQGLGVHVSRKQTTFRVTKIFSLFTNQDADAIQHSKQSITSGVV